MGVLEVKEIVVQVVLPGVPVGYQAAAALGHFVLIVLQAELGARRGPPTALCQGTAAVDAAILLFQLHNAAGAGVVGQAVAVEVKVQTLGADGGRHQHKRQERRVEGVAAFAGSCGIHRNGKAPMVSTGGVGNIIFQKLYQVDVLLRVIVILRVILLGGGKILQGGKFFQHIGQTTILTILKDVFCVGKIGKGAAAVGKQIVRQRPRQLLRRGGLTAATRVLFGGGKFIQTIFTQVFFQQRLQIFSLDVGNRGVGNFLVQQIGDRARRYGQIREYQRLGILLIPGKHTAQRVGRLYRRNPKQFFYNIRLAQAAGGGFLRHIVGIVGHHNIPQALVAGMLVGGQLQVRVDVVRAAVLVFCRHTIQMRRGDSGAAGNIALAVAAQVGPKAQQLGTIAAKQVVSGVVLAH